MQLVLFNFFSHVSNEKQFTFLSKMLCMNSLVWISSQLFDFHNTINTSYTAAFYIRILLLALFVFVSVFYIA